MRISRIILLLTTHRRNYSRSTLFKSAIRRDDHVDRLIWIFYVTCHSILDAIPDDYILKQKSYDFLYDFLNCPNHVKNTMSTRFSICVVRWFRILLVCFFTSISLCHESLHTPLIDARSIFLNYFLKKKNLRLHVYLLLEGRIRFFWIYTCCPTDHCRNRIVYPDVVWSLTLELLLVICILHDDLIWAICYEIFMCWRIQYDEF